ncbi:hypothetical protein G6F23_015322 [Rhizopus arrhizus]|nr:hypothetical protein G6F23_015322 [Rhizopus arrhizus]
MGISNLLGALVATLVTTFLTEQQIGEWGWRVPFIIGLAIAPVGLWMRRALDETPHFREEQARQARQNDRGMTPLLAVVRDYPKELLTGLCMSVLNPWASPAPRLS